MASAGESGQLEASLRQLDQALDAGRYHLQQRESTVNSSSPDVDSTYMGYVSHGTWGCTNFYYKPKCLSLTSSLQMRLMGECRGSIDAVKRAEGELTEDEDDMPGLTNPTSTDGQSAGQLHPFPDGLPSLL